MAIGNLSHSSKKIGRNLPVLKRNISGNILEGLTPDWNNFVLMSKWVAKNIDKNEKVASRKPSISYIYTGREFEGISSVPSQPVDSLPVVAPEGKSIVVIDISERQSLILAPDLQYVVIGAIRKNDKAYTTFNNDLMYIDKDDYGNDIKMLNVGLYFVDTAELEMIITEMGIDGVKCMKDAVQFKNSCNAISDKVYVYNPDQLLENLNTRKIKYLILASLRLYPEKNTGVIINALHKYVEYIDMKYPDKFRTVHKIGASEPSELVEYLGIP